MSLSHMPIGGCKFLLFGLFFSLPCHASISLSNTDTNQKNATTFTVGSSSPVIRASIKTASGEAIEAVNLPFDVQVKRSNEPRNYIVQLQDTPLLVKKQQLLARMGKQVSSVSGKRQFAAQLQSHQQLIQQVQRQLVANWTQSKQINTVVRQHHRLFNAIVVEATPEQINALKQHPQVTHVVASKPVKALLTESVPLVNAPEVWQQKDRANRALTGQGVLVAIVDTGIDYTHPDLGGCIGPGCRVIGGYDFVNDDDDPMDDNVHGTHVAGIVCTRLSHSFVGA